MSGGTSFSMMHVSPFVPMTQTPVKTPYAEQVCAAPCDRVVCHDRTVTVCCGWAVDMCCGCAVAEL